MGAGESTQVSARLNAASPSELLGCLAGLDVQAKQKLLEALRPEEEQGGLTSKPPHPPDEYLQSLRAAMELKDRAAPVLDADIEADSAQHLEELSQDEAVGGHQPIIYCNGVYDMCHIGHQVLFQNAAKHGRLIVGVHGDVACAGYKRPPMMSANERARQIAGCKGVWKVLKNAPLETITEELLQKYKIDIVAIGEEYLKGEVNDDKWYRLPRETGKFVSMPRTDDISTSELIKRCADSMSKST